MEIGHLDSLVRVDGVGDGVVVVLLSILQLPLGRRGQPPPTQAQQHAHGRE
jgi:hypothetical protein